MALQHFNWESICKLIASNLNGFVCEFSGDSLALIGRHRRTVVNTSALIDLHTYILPFNPWFSLIPFTGFSFTT